jgi:hypothetical protein
MVRLMRRWNPDKGLKLIGDATAAEDSGAKYFLAMLKYRCNLVDPEAMELLQEINGGPSPPDGRWKNHNLRRLCYLVKQDIDNIALLYCLMTATTKITFRCCPSRIPTSASEKRDVGATGWIPKRSSTTVVPSVTSVMSSTSGRVASAPPWSTPSAG